MAASRSLTSAGVQHLLPDAQDCHGLLCVQMQLPAQPALSYGHCLCFGDLNLLQEKCMLCMVQHGVKTGCLHQHSLEHPARVVDHHRAASVMGILWQIKSLSQVPASKQDGPWRHNFLGTGVEGCLSAAVTATVWC